MLFNRNEFSKLAGLFVLICNALRDRNCCVTIIERVINWSPVNSWNCPGTPQFICLNKASTSFSPSGHFYRSLVNFMNSAVTKAIWPARMLSLAMRVKSISRASPIVPQRWWECARCSLPDNYAQCVCRVSLSNKYFAFALQIGKAFTILRHTIYLVLALLGTIFTLSWKCFGTSWLLYGLFVVTFFSEFQLKIKIFFLFLGG